MLSSGSPPARRVPTPPPAAPIHTFITLYNSPLALPLPSAAGSHTRICSAALSARPARSVLLAPTPTSPARSTHSPPRGRVCGLTACAWPRAPRSQRGNMCRPRRPTRAVSQHCPRYLAPPAAVASLAPRDVGLGSRRRHLYSLISGGCAASRSPPDRPPLCPAPLFHPDPPARAPSGRDPDHPSAAPHTRPNRTRATIR